MHLYIKQFLLGYDKVISSPKMLMVSNNKGLFLVYFTDDLHMYFFFLVVQGIEL
jgi:hypothetical protein